MLRPIQRFKNLFHLFEAIVANIFYGFPSRSLKVIGVTGTDGKTTTASLIYHILKNNHKKVSIISTVKTIIAGHEQNIGFHTTTPNSFLIQKLLKLAKNKKEEYFVLETSSHALDQNRVYGINYEVSALTNITHEHMDYHPNYDHYLKTKAKLFLNSLVSILNADDASYQGVKVVLEENNKKYFSYSLKKKADYNVDISKKLNLDLEEFNNYNYLAAYSAAKLLGLREQEIFEAMKNFRLPKGRMDLVYDKEFKVIVDFANTPNAVAQVLKSVRVKYLKNKGRIIHIFGTPGKRDKTKRPLMGKESERYADLIILTGDDYRDEDPIKICEEIASGFSKKDKLYSTIIDRKSAIEKALGLVKKDDVIILTGIGHQKTLAQGNQEIPWDEEKAVIEAIKYTSLRSRA